MSAIARLLRRNGLDCPGLPATLRIGFLNAILSTRSFTTITGSPTSSHLDGTTQNDSSRLVIEKIERFPQGAYNFQHLRKQGFSFFDKTRYIPLLSETSSPVKLFCRPRRFGKSLTLSMMEKFHGVQFKGKYNQLFKGLDVDRVVNQGDIEYGRYLILGFDFSLASLGGTSEKSVENLNDYINSTLQDFVQFYEASGLKLKLECCDFGNRDEAALNLYWVVRAVDTEITRIQSKADHQNIFYDVRGIFLTIDEYDAASTQYFLNDSAKAWRESPLSNAYAPFFQAIKSSMGSCAYGIGLVYMTGIMPLRTQNFSSYNIVENLSFDHRFSGLCGLTSQDVSNAVEMICKNHDEQKKHILRQLTFYANGYHFCPDRCVETVFNTSTIIEYLNAIAKDGRFTIDNPPNSEINERVLSLGADSFHAVAFMQQALQVDNNNEFQRIPYTTLLDHFSMTDLKVNTIGEPDTLEAAWHAFVIYQGGLTFDRCNPSKLLVIPNHIAASRIGKDMLTLFKVNSNDIQVALFALANEGAVDGVLREYQKVMETSLRQVSDFDLNEADYRDRLCGTLLQNAGIKPEMEFKVTKPLASRAGFIGILIESEKVCVLLELKNIPLNHLELKRRKILERAEELHVKSLRETLQLRFNKRKKYGEGTIGEFAETICPQINDCINSYELKQTVRRKNFRAYSVVFIGSRKIVFGEVGADGKWTEEGFQLAEYGAMSNM
ncbi:hypothetical protein BDD12DRAFT_318684 [Trichophaea hybrida]|nr:hypothetical protein BDD12DRAFT_318684 [Trichophaea hybrida]